MRLVYRPLWGFALNVPRWCRLLALLLLALPGAAPALAQLSTNQPADIAGSDKAKLPKANSSRLSFDENGLAYLNIKTKRKTAEGYEDNVRRVLFTGIAFTEGENWRAEVTYSNGILHGPVVVVANNKVLSQFEHVEGKKVVKEQGKGP